MPLTVSFLFLFLLPSQFLCQCQCQFLYHLIAFTLITCNIVNTTSIIIILYIIIYHYYYYYPWKAILSLFSNFFTSCLFRWNYCYLYFTVIIFLMRLLCVTYRFRTTLTKNKQQFETHGFGCVSQQNNVGQHRNNTAGFNFFKVKILGTNLIILIKNRSGQST